MPFFVKISQMLIEFSVANFRSFRDMQKLTMQAAPIRSNDTGLDEGNVFESNGLRMLKSKAIFGLNASGKSNLIMAIGMFQFMVDRSVSNEGFASDIWEERFGLITNWESEPVFFQLIFSENNVIYRYGFQIKNSKVESEWLFSRPNKLEVKLFTREQGGIDVRSNNFRGGGEFIPLALSGEHEIFRSDALFLTGAALMGNIQAQEIRNAIRKIIFVDGINDRTAIQFGMSILEKGTDKEKSVLRELVKEAETGAVDIQLIDAPIDFSSKQAKSSSSQKLNNLNSKILISFRNRYDEEGNLIDQIKKPFRLWESEGTQKWFGISALIFNALKLGRTFVIDEFDARFHPNLTLKIVELFNSSETNPHNAQLLFESHDTGLLSRAKLRRDQICLVDKDKYGISKMRTLIELKGVRKDASIEKEYLNGSYGAVPYLDNINKIIISNLSESNELSKAE